MAARGSGLAMGAPIMGGRGVEGRGFAPALSVGAEGAGVPQQRHATRRGVYLGGWPMGAATPRPTVVLEHLPRPEFAAVQSDATVVRPEDEADRERTKRTRLDTVRRLLAEI